MLNKDTLYASMPFDPTSCGSCEGLVESDWNWVTDGESVLFNRARPHVDLCVVCCVLCLSCDVCSVVCCVKS